MSQKANPTLIGIFIFVGLLLGVAGMMLFTSSRLFTQKRKFIVYFESSLNGLKEGAPVKFRGVTVGSVSRVMIKFNQAAHDTAMPVIFEVEERQLRERIEGPTLFDSLENLGEEIRKGLRASLETESLVTGILYISIEVEPAPPPPVYHQIKQVYFEVPSRPTEFQRLKKSLANLDLAGLERQVKSLITNVDSVVGGLKTEAISDNLTNVLGSANRVLTAPDLTNSLTSLRTTLDRYRHLGEKVEGRVDPLVNSVTNTLDEARVTLVKARGGIENLRDMLAPDSPFRHQLSAALDQLADALQSVGLLAELLHDQPNALITGSKSPQGRRPNR